MNRRFFLQRVAAASASRASEPVAHHHDRSDAPRSLASAGDLSPYTPRIDKPWDARRAAHLLSRCGLRPTWAQMEAALSAGAAATVDAQIGIGSAPSNAPGTWADQRPYQTVGDTERIQYDTWQGQLMEWWTRQMLTPGAALREKMVLFWHNHFVSDYPTVYVPQYLYLQNKLFRDNFAGDFRHLTKKVTIDPAMLIYLNGSTSRAGNPNENYARELLELFTLGVGSYSNGAAHYTEHDIIELARALTGWTIDINGAIGSYAAFRSARFDTTNKTIFGQTQNWGIEGTTPHDVIDLIFQQQDPDNAQPRAAIFLCEKLYHEFVHHVPDPEIIRGMAATLVANNWNVAPVLRQLLLSEHFMDDNVIGARIKSPIEFVLGAINQLGMAAPFYRPYVDPNRLELHDPLVAMSNLSQLVFYAPNVKGWPGGRSWISGATMPLRIRYAKYWLEPVQGSQPYNFDPIAFAKTLPDYADAEKLIDNMITLLCPFGVGSETRALILDDLLQGGPAYDWKIDGATAAVRLRAALLHISRLGEFQLI